MASIESIVATIRTAIYGKDMREAIADGIEMSYNTGTEKINALGLYVDSEGYICQKLSGE